MANCEWQKTNDDMYRCKHCRILSEEPTEQYCQFASKPYLTHGKAVVSDPYYLESTVNEKGEYSFKCERCGFTHMDKEAEVILHSCIDYIENSDYIYIDYEGQTEITKKYKFVCKRCGFKYSDRKLKRIAHRCSDCICDLEDFEGVFKCRNCGIVLEQKEIRLCQEKNGVQGLGDVIAKVAKSVGIKQDKGCGCGKKQKALNKLVPFK